MPPDVDSTSHTTPPRGPTRRGKVIAEECIAQIVVAVGLARRTRIVIQEADQRQRHDDGVVARSVALMRLTAILRWRWRSPRHSVSLRRSSTSISSSGILSLSQVHDAHQRGGSPTGRVRRTRRAAGSGGIWAIAAAIVAAPTAVPSSRVASLADLCVSSQPNPYRARSLRFAGGSRTAANGGCRNTATGTTPAGQRDAVPSLYRNSTRFNISSALKISAISIAPPMSVPSAALDGTNRMPA